MNSPVTIDHEPTPIPPPQANGHAVAIRSASPLDIAPSKFKQALERRGENRKSLIEWIRSALVDGVDFGRIHVSKYCQNKYNCTNDSHFSKPSLRKPGAEKICGMLGVTATFPTLKDYEAAAIEGREIKSIILRCHLLTADERVVADGVGARSVEQDSGDLNKALKMCKKSALIDATLQMGGLSEVFTQDIEDMAPEQAGDEPPPPADESIVPSGKHSGAKWADVPADYLTWVSTSGKGSRELQEGAKKELARREQPQQNNDPEPAGPERVPCGKHKGKLWVEASDDYLQWAIASDKAPDVLKEGARIEIACRVKRRAGDIDGGEKIPH